MQRLVRHFHRVLRRPATLLCALGLAGILPGCVEYHQTIFLYAGGGGAVEIELHVPRELWTQRTPTGFEPAGDLRPAAEALATETPGVTLTDFSVQSSLESQGVRWSYDFEDPAALAQLAEHAGEFVAGLYPGRWSGLQSADAPFAVEQLGRFHTLHERIPAWPELAGADEGRPSPIAGGRVTLTVRTPYRITSYDAGLLDPSGKSITWSGSLLDLLRGGLDTRIAYEKPFPVALLGGSAVGILAALGAIWLLALRHMRRGLEPPEQAPTRPRLPSDSGEDRLDTDWSSV